MTVSLDAMMDGSSTDNESTSDASESTDDHDELLALCEEIGADYEHAKAYVEEHGAKDKLLKAARKVRDNTEHVKQVLETYRRWNDQYRIRQSWMYSVDGSFESWSDEFYYGNGDNYNTVQEEARDLDGINLAFYKALFPEPDEEYWPTEPVVYHEHDIGYGDGQQDSHVYVTTDFVEDYADFTMEIEGEQKPRPPTDEELASMGGGSGGDTSGEVADDVAIDPSDFTVKGLKGALDKMDFDDDELRALRDAEQAGDDRKTAVEAIERAMSDDAADDSDDESSEAERIIDANDLDAKPKTVKSMLRKGMSEENIVDILTA